MLAKVPVTFDLLINQVTTLMVKLNKKILCVYLLAGMWSSLTTSIPTCWMFSSTSSRLSRHPAWDVRLSVYWDSWELWTRTNTGSTRGTRSAARWAHPPANPWTRSHKALVSQVEMVWWTLETCNVAHRGLGIYIY